jgi:hypothetical protein
LDSEGADVAFAAVPASNDRRVARPDLAVMGEPPGGRLEEFRRLAIQVTDELAVDLDANCVRVVGDCSALL